MDKSLDGYKHRAEIKPERAERILVWGALSAALILGLVLRLYGAKLDLPYVYDPDEHVFVNPALRMLLEGTLNPGWFGHPGTTTIYVNALIYFVLLKFGIFSGWFASLSEFRDYYQQDPTLVYLLPRIFSGLVGTAVIAATFLAARTTFNAAAAAAAALFVAVMPTQVEYSHIIRTDLLATLLILLAVWQAAMIVDGRRLLHYLLAGAITGVAVATKYPAILVAVLVPLAHIISGRGWIAEWWKVALAGLAALAAAFVASPYLFLNFTQVLNSVQRELRPTHLSHTGEGFVIDLWWYVVQLATQFGWLFVCLAIAGAAAVVLKRNKAGVLLLAFVVLYLAFVSGLYLRFARYVLPVLPFVAIFAAGGALYLIELTLRNWSRFAQGALVLAIAATASAPLAYSAWQWNRQATATDTRTVTRDWILKNIEPGSSLFVERYGPQLPFGVYRLFMSKKRRFVEVESTLSNVKPFGVVAYVKLGDLKRVQYVVLGPYEERFKREAEQYPEAVLQYDKLHSFSEVIYEAQARRQAVKGEPIRVLKIDQEALMRHLAGQVDPDQRDRHEAPLASTGAGG